jgi:rRNA maturation RNase YbeY
MNSIHFHSEDIDFTLKQKTALRQWIKSIIDKNRYQLQYLNYIFTSDAFLLKINREYLDHNTFTDIITFDHSSDNHLIEADIFISVERVKENASALNVSFNDELHRVMIHGVLHLFGFEDESESKKKEMRKKENHYLDLRF